MRRPAVNPGLDLELAGAGSLLAWPGACFGPVSARGQPGWLRGQLLQRRTSQIVTARNAMAASVKSAVSIPWNAQNLLAGW